ncbi:TVP38/TMEM64 family protein [Maridesulfovibrio bastinii]|uniref:TVP38/TMEM64 family protein n=1 Tax=Maridesulfovibrio bastinii TaxID=47157 RepID=UPI000408C78C|nr:VTT domain-containing protein [Maridesulfovibrio bastinii]
MTILNKESKGTVKALVKGLSLLAILGIAVFLLRYLGLDEALDKGWIDTHVRSHGFAGVLTYVGLAVFFSALGFPRQLICFMGGYAYGFAMGAFLGTIGTTLGCAVTILYARLAGRNFIKKRFGSRISKIDSFLSRSPFNMALAIRFFPLGSNVVANLAAGVTSIPILPFIAGSAIGYLPQNIVFALFGSGTNVSSNTQMIMAVILFVLSTLLGVKMYKKYRTEEVETGLED